MCEIWCAEDSASILKHHCKIWYQFPRCGTGTVKNGGCCFLWAFGWLLSFLGRFWMIAWRVALNY